MYAVPSDVQARWPGYDPSEHDSYAETLIGDAERLIADRVPDLAGRISAGVITERTVKQVVCNMVIRTLRNPEGYRQEDDGNYKYVYASSAFNPGEVTLSRTDMAALQGQRRAVTIPAADPALPYLFRQPWPFTELLEGDGSP